MEVIIMEIPDLHIISSGITENNKILLEGIQKVKDDEKRKHDFAKSKDVIAHLQLKTEYFYNFQFGCTIEEYI